MGKCVQIIVRGVRQNCLENEHRQNSSPSFMKRTQSPIQVNKYTSKLTNRFYISHKHPAAKTNRQKTKNKNKKKPNNKTNKQTNNKKKKNRLQHAMWYRDCIHTLLQPNKAGCVNMLHEQQDLQTPSCMAQYQAGGDEADQRNAGTTTSRNGRSCLSTRP